MFEITKEYSFEAAHHLPDHQGQCHNVHGHSYVLEVALSAIHLQTTGSEAGMVVDFVRIDDVMKPLVARVDHGGFALGYADTLNEALPSEYQPPTAEHIAEWAAHALIAHFGPSVRCVRVWETAKCSAAYYQD